MFSRKWDYIFMQAEAQSKVDKKREKQERKILVINWIGNSIGVLSSALA